jgi:hypothetical protein
MGLMGLMGLMGEEPPGDNPNFRVRRGRETRAERGRKFRIPHSLLALRPLCLCVSPSSVSPREHPFFNFSISCPRKGWFP